MGFLGTSPAVRIHSILYLTIQFFIHGDVESVAGYCALLAVADVELDCMDGY